MKLLAGWFPSADVPSTVLKLASPTVPTPVSSAATPVRPVVHAPAPKPAVVAPLSAERYRLQVTIGDAAHDDFRHLQDAMRRDIPSGDPAVIVARALALLRRTVDRRAFAATERPRSAPPTNPSSRHIPAHVERAVWNRDQGQCAFEGPRHRGQERSFLELHHLTPWIVGGAASVENIALRCRAHNARESELVFGRFDPTARPREVAGIVICPGTDPRRPNTQSGQRVATPRPAGGGARRRRLHEQ